MKILITGNLGYVGTTLSQYLKLTYPHATITGYDTGYFKQWITAQNMDNTFGIDIQHFGDIRTIEPEVISGQDIIIHLAAISNDPIGNKFEQVTMEVNHAASIRLAKLSLEYGVSQFVFASSCSVYGTAGDADKTESSPLNPLTAYAKSKLTTEQDLEKYAKNGMNITCLRFATACGMSNRLRLDLVLNDFVASALVNKKIEILSDGTPWRPLIDVSDMSRAMDWAIQHNNSGYFICNTGSNDWNFTVKELAEKVKEILPETKISINQQASPDKRSYKVNFDLYKKLSGNFYPQNSVKNTIENLIIGLKAFHFSEPEFRSGNLIRLNALNQLLQSNAINQQLMWNK